MQRNFSQAEVARAFVVTRTTVWGWEKGEAKPDAETMERLADYFGVRSAWLITGDGPMEAKPTAPVDSETEGLDIERGKQQRRGRPPANPGDEQSGGSGRRGA